MQKSHHHTDTVVHLDDYRKLAKPENSLNNLCWQFVGERDLSMAIYFDPLGGAEKDDEVYESLRGLSQEEAPISDEIRHWVDRLADDGIL